MSIAEPAALASVRIDAQQQFSPQIARMLSSPSQGAFLSFLATLQQSRSVLELGSFTGYSTLWLAKNFDSDPNSFAVDSKRTVFSCEIDAQTAAIAQRNFARVLGDQWPTKIRFQQESAQSLLDRARRTGQQFDLVFLDADKRNYLHYLRVLMGEDTASAVDEHGQKSLLVPGALIVVDNTLWKGLVLHLDEALTSQTLLPQAESFGSKERMMRIATEMHAFNAFVHQHPALAPLMLPLRDGFSLVRYQPSEASEATATTTTPTGATRDANGL
jgi:caffeoyl-CoA O-methyltransferase